jgi:uncharacterized damage-inducible protein DinB
MPSLAHHFVTMAYNNAWANHRLGKACLRLSDEEFAAPRVSFFPSLPATLNHLLTVDWYYVDAMERSVRGLPPNPDWAGFFEPEEPYDAAADLVREQRAVDQRLITFCEGLQDADLERILEVPRSWGVQKEGATRLLAHLFQHQIHHRGQVHAMLAGTSVAPPQLDEFFSSNEAHLRAEDFAELGWTEGRIWGWPQVR